MTKFNTAVAALEVVVGFSAEVKQVSYIAMVAERKAKALVASRKADWTKAKNSLTFAINNEDTDLAWATMGTVEYWKSEVAATEEKLVAARVMSNAITEHVATVRERIAA